MFEPFGRLHVVHVNHTPLAFFDEAAMFCAEHGREARDERRAQAVRKIKPVGEWDGLALPPGAAKRLGL
ncbi:MAG: hypothetical protein ABL864_13430 [Terricaulis sp.]